MLMIWVNPCHHTIIAKWLSLLNELFSYICIRVSVFIVIFQNISIHHYIFLCNIFHLNNRYINYTYILYHIITSTMTQNLQNINFTNFGFIPSSINNSSPTPISSIENPSINENIPETQNTPIVENIPVNTEQPDTMVPSSNTNPILYDDLLNVLYKNSELNRRGNITINEQTFEDGTLVFKKDDIITPNYKGNSTLVYPVDYTYESTTTKLDPKLVQDSIVLLEQVKQKITDSTKQITV